MATYFKDDEFKCKCGCGTNNISNKLVDKLDSVRWVIDKPIVINSACRCEKHNKAVGGSVASSHLKGLAVDIACTDSSYRDLLLRELLKQGFSRIGIAKTFIHIDIDESKPDNVIWVY